MADRHQLMQASRVLNDALGPVASGQGASVAAGGQVDLRACCGPGVRATAEHLALLLHRFQAAPPEPPEVCTVNRFREMATMCACLDVPPDVRRAIAAHMAGAATIPLLRVEVYDGDGRVRHRHDLLLAGPQETCLLRRKYTHFFDVWTLDPAFGRSEVHDGGPAVLRAAAYHALRDVLDVGLQMDAVKPMFGLVSEWARSNAFMFVDEWVGEQTWQELQHRDPCRVDFDALAPTVRVLPGRSAALMRFSRQFVVDAMEATEAYNADAFKTSVTYTEKKELAHVQYMDPPVAVRDGGDDDDDGAPAPRHVLRLEPHAPPPPRYATARKSTGGPAPYRRLATAPKDDPIVGVDAPPRTSP
jgi:hypothetical protein